MYARPNNVVDEVKRHIGTDKKYMIDGKGIHQQLLAV